MSNSNTLITTKARENMVKARAGAITLPTIVGMAFGNGGVDAGGVPIPPVAGQTALNNELLRKTLSGYTFPTSTTCRYSCTLLSTDVPNENISEIALYDSNGDLVAIKTFTAKGKDPDIDQTYTIDDVF